MSKSELAAALAKYNSAMGWSTIAVAVGIFGEYISHFIFTKEKKSRAEWLCTILFAVLVIGGVSGEWWYGKRLSETADSLQRIADGEVAAAKQKASEADSRQPCRLARAPLPKSHRSADRPDVGGARERRDVLCEPRFSRLHG